MLLINCSNREKNCFKVLNDIKKEDDKLISLANKNMSFCLGCGSCSSSLPKHCVIDDFITNNLYDEIINADNIVLASPMYMSNINAVLKNLLDRLNPLYHHHLLNDKKIYLILTGGTSKEDNEEEINGIISYFESISEWLGFSFQFLDYFEGYESINVDNYDNKINSIKDILN